MVILRNPVHPGEVLKEDFLDEYDMSAGKLAQNLKVSRNRIERLVRAERGMSPDTAMRLSKLFGTTPEFWLNLQRGYDLAMAAQDPALADDLNEILPLAS
ncbi:addiction module antidote protein, HigA family [Epibacterium ulvae]|uniref:Addiction module antidote protein, HigA family n=1 Tax=Epibacterium ulvae TaxID=1156985 RepID=A0A1G5RIC6_9RHOB|nr:HigA family addiction module antitoxin [Epibacterium ulvae]SCZ73560.1 addiction module antidote protein, HigA family [Epibacterium ulvae]